MARTYPWKVSDDLWKRVEPLMLPAPSYQKGGHPRMPDRQAFMAIVYALPTGIQWKAFPRELGTSSTVQAYSSVGMWRDFFCHEVAFPNEAYTGRAASSTGNIVMTAG